MNGLRVSHIPMSNFKSNASLQFSQIGALKAKISFRVLSLIRVTHA